MQFLPFDVASDTQSTGHPVDCHADSTINWQVPMDITSEDGQKALLLYFGGERVAEVYDTIKDRRMASRQTKNKFTAPCASQVNIQYEIYTYSGTQRKMEVRRWISSAPAYAHLHKPVSLLADANKETHS